MQYLMHAGLLLAACFAYYWVMLRGETHFQLNRWILLGCLVGSLTLPLVTVPASWSLREAMAAEAVEIPPAQLEDEAQVGVGTEAGQDSELSFTDAEGNELTLTPPAEGAAGGTLLTSPGDANPEASADPTQTISKDSAPAAPIDWWKVIRWIYLAGVVIFGANFLAQFLQLVVRLLRNPGHDLGDFRLVEMREDEAPFSFWNRIFLNPERYDEDTFHQIVQHEQIHVDQKHSIDLLLAELVIVFQWFNPFAWWYRSAIEHNLEFLTDAEMLRIGNDPESYQLSLVKVAIPNFPNGLVASYNQSFLEKRITMMKTRKSSMRSGWKYFTLLPMLLLSVLQFNAVAQVAPQVAAVPAPQAAPAPVTAPVATVPVPSPAPQPIPAPASAAPLSLSNVPNPTPAPTPSPAMVPNPQPAPAPTPELAMVMGDAEGEINSWTALIEDDEICFQFMSRSNAFNNRYNYQSSRCFDLSLFRDLPRDNMGSFTLTRKAGTITFKGVFEGDDGVGNFSFEPSEAFAATLKSAGFGSYKDKEMFLLFMADMDDEYLAYLKSQGYNPSHDKLLELAIFYDDLDELKTRLAEFKRLGFGKPPLSKLIELQIHGVDEDYAREMQAAGFEGLTLQDLMEARIHGVSGAYLSTMAKAGFRNLSFDQVKQMAIHGISEEYVEEMSSLGYRNLSADDIVHARIHGVNAERIADWRRAGLTDLTLDQAKQMAIHGVDSELVKALADFGFTNLTPDEVVSAKIHGLNARRMAELKSTGLPMSDLNEVKSAMIHGVTPEFINGMRAIGYKSLSMDEFVQAKIHGVNAEWAASFREVGFKDIPFNTLIQLRIHGVSADFIKDRRKEGRSLEDYVKMKIHGL
ncbi:MAG: M56 family metallopeptidase [Bacteroidota bacterium]